MKKRSERGAALAEVGVVLPFLLLLSLGLSEIGFLVADHLAVASAAREGARIGAAAGDYDIGTQTADDLILRSVEQAACSMPFGSVVRVSIYSADTSGGMLDPATQLNQYIPGGGGLNCAPTGPTGMVCSNGCPWDPSTRSVTIGSLADLGITVDFHHDAVTDFIPLPSVNWSEMAVMRIQPETTG
jgi:hypothetical protein